MLLPTLFRALWACTCMLSHPSFCLCVLVCAAQVSRPLCAEAAVRPSVDERYCGAALSGVHGADDPTYVRRCPRRHPRARAARIRVATSASLPHPTTSTHTPAHARTAAVSPATR